VQLTPLSTHWAPRKKKKKMVQSFSDMVYLVNPEVLLCKCSKIFGINIVILHKAYSTLTGTVARCVNLKHFQQSLLSPQFQKTLMINQKLAGIVHCLLRLFYNVPFTGVMWLEDMAQLLHSVNWGVAKPADSCAEIGYGSVTFCM